MKKFLSVILSLLMVIAAASTLPFAASALEPSGSCGENVTYSFNTETGELTICGSGEMYDYEWSSSPFQNNSNIISVTVNSGVTDVSNYAFYNCTGLTSIKLPESVKAIGKGAFYNCTSLSNLSLPNGIVSIGVSAFSNTAYYNNEDNWEKYTNDDYEDQEVLYIDNYLIRTKSSFLGSYEIKAGTRIIANSAFSGSKYLTELDIPNSVVIIGDDAFSQCEGLSDISIPNSVISIGKEAFYGCNTFKNVTVPGSVKSIGRAAFINCLGLESVVVSEGVESIGDSAFRHNNLLTNISLPSSLKSIGADAFDNTGYYNDENNWYNGALYLDNYLLNAQKCTAESYTVNDNTQVIAGDAFYGCKSLTSITIPNSVTSIGKSAFDYCSSLTDVYYDGTKEQWSTIKIGDGNSYYLTKSTIHCTDGDIEPHTHSYASTVTAPTCTEQGYTTHTCECGDSYVDTYVDALGHKSDKGTVTKKATYTATGVKTYKCTVCGEVIKTETIAKLPKKANTLVAKGKTATVKFANLKKKNQTVTQKNAFVVSKAQGKVTYKKASGNAKITVSSAGKLTVKKGLKKGTYKIKVKVTAAGNTTYKAVTKTVTVTIKVK